MRYHVGIDLGTSAVKVVVLDDAGQVASKGSSGYEVIHPKPGWSEQEPDAWWKAVGDATRKALAAVDARRVASVGLSGQLNGLLLLDREKRPIGNALIWLDLRSAEEAAWLNEHYSELLRRTIVNPANPIYVGAKLLWLRRNQPERLERAKYLALAKDYINYRLTGELATDHSDASCTLLYDLTRRDWLPDILRLLGIEAGMLPPLLESTDVVGQVTADAEAETGIPAGTPAVAGAGDVCALSVGSGALQEGLCSITLGTAGHVVTASPDLSQDGFNRIWQMHHAVPGKLIRLGLVMSGGLSLSWFRREFGEAEALQASRDGGDPFEGLLARAENSGAGARGVLFLPFLEGAATPFQNPSLKAAFLNVTSAHGKDDLVRAVLEGVAFNIRDCTAAFAELGSTIEEVRLSEGGSRSPLWCQIISDVLDLSVTPLREIDASALGAAILAKAGTGGAANPEDVVREVVSVQEGKTFHPDPSRVETYDARYRQYRAMAELLDDATR